MSIAKVPAARGEAVLNEQSQTITIITGKVAELEELSKYMGESVNFVVNQEIEQYVESNLKQIQRIKSGVCAAEAGQTLSADEMFNPLAPSISSANGLTVKIAEPAAQDLADIIGKISKDSPLLAEDVLRTFGDMLQKVQDIPDLGGTGRYPNTRELQFYGCPVTLVYAVDAAAAVTVVAVF